MSIQTADVVICGAGIAGLSAAYHLAVREGVRDILIVDDHAPLSLTSDKSTECYRNWWPGPGDAMVKLMNRGIDLLEELAHESGNIFNMNRRGYLFATANPDRIADFRAHAEEAASLGAGPVRYHDDGEGTPSYQPAALEGFEDEPTGADIITDPALIREHFPYLSPDTLAVVHPRRCGWFSAQQLGMYLLRRVQEQGGRLLPARLVDVQVERGRIAGVSVAQDGTEERIGTRHFINAAGPHLKSVGRMMGIDLPVFSELHAKVSFQDHRKAFPRNAPLLIWSDSQHLSWTEAERRELEADEEARYLLDLFPHGVHARPDGPEDSPVVLILWTYETDQVEPTFPIRFGPHHPEILLRGLARMIPAISIYFERMPRPFMDGGYYTKTRENRPLIGPLPVEGAWVLGALSGFGLMASQACGELLAHHLTRLALPPYAPCFALERYSDPDYIALLENWGETGQL